MKYKEYKAAFTFSFVVVAFIAFIFQLSGCESTKGENIPTAPSGSTALSLSVSPSTSIAADGSSFFTITAAVTGWTSGTVEFTTSLGTLSASSANVNSAGNAEVTLTSSTGGTATVRATAGSESASTTVTFGQGGIVISGTGIGSVVPDAGGTSESTTITFTVTDVNGSALSGFAVTLATPSSNNGTANWSESSPNTDNSGVATSILTTTSASSIVANATVTISASATGAGSASAQVVFQLP